jgi:hypothetical protein
MKILIFIISEFELGKSKEIIPEKSEGEGEVEMQLKRKYFNLTLELIY